MKKISRFIHILNDTCLWDAIAKKIIEVDNNIVNYVKVNNGKIGIKDIPTKLEELGIITTLEDEKELIEKIKHQTTDNQFQVLYLITSTS